MRIRYRLQSGKLIECEYHTDKSDYRYELKEGERWVSTSKDEDGAVHHFVINGNGDIKAGFGGKYKNVSEIGGKQTHSLGDRLFTKFNTFYIRTNKGWEDVNGVGKMMSDAEAEQYFNDGKVIPSDVKTMFEGMDYNQLRVMLKAVPYNTKIKCKIQNYLGEMVDVEATRLESGQWLYKSNVIDGDVVDVWDISQKMGDALTEGKYEIETVTRPIPKFSKELVENTLDNITPIDKKDLYKHIEIQTKNHLAVLDLLRSMDDGDTVRTSDCVIKKNGDEWELQADENYKKHHDMRDAINNIIKDKRGIFIHNGREIVNTYTMGATPNSVAGVKRGEPMSHANADSGKVNPKYSTYTAGFTHNCQTCVVAYELRRRGYNVEAKPKTKSNKLGELAKDYLDVWIDPVTHEKPKVRAIRTVEDFKMKEGERYALSFNHSRGGHVVTAMLIDGKPMVYDPQVDKTFEAKEYLEHGWDFKITRIDNMELNPYYVNDILKKGKK